MASLWGSYLSLSALYGYENGCKGKGNQELQLDFSCLHTGVEVSYFTIASSLKFPLCAIDARREPLFD